MCVSDDSPIEYAGSIMTLNEFGIYVGIYPVVIRYRYAQHPFADWIIKAEYDFRHYRYVGHFYNLEELSLIAKIPYPIMYRRIRRDGWGTERAVQTPYPLR